MQSIFPPQSLTNILGEVVADAGRTQLRTAETEKYPHVTYFLNGGREEPFPGEDRIMVPSPKVATYDLQPEMSAPELTDKVVAAIDSGKYDLIVLNYANPDMVGHTGSLPAAIKAVETVDTGLGRIADAIERAGGALVVTADHGNCEMMRDPETGGPHTAHTTNPVPLFLLGARNRALVTEGRLADIAPTLLELMDLPKPAEMTGGRCCERIRPQCALDGGGAKPVSQPHCQRIRSRFEVGCVIRQDPWNAADNCSPRRRFAEVVVAVFDAQRDALRECPIEAAADIPAIGPIIPPDDSRPDRRQRYIERVGIEARNGISASHVWQPIAHRPASPPTGRENDVAEMRRAAEQGNCLLGA